MIICQKTNHGRIFRCCNSMLYLVELKALYGMAHIVRRSPFADICFQLEALRLCPSINGLKFFYWLRQFIPIQID